MAGVAATRRDAGEQPTDTRKAMAVWWRRLVADQALEKVKSIIRVRKYELDSLIADGKPEQFDQTAWNRRVARATQLVEAPLPDDRAGANELLDKLDAMFPLVADDERLRLMLESELERNATLFTAAAQKRARDLIEATEHRSGHRGRLEALVTAAVRERNDQVREERITGELRQNYLTWLGSVLLLLLLGVAGFAILAAHSGLWADVGLALLSGALGGTLSGVIRLRVPESRLAALKSLGPVMLVQPLVGAVGGLVLFAIWRSGLLKVSGLNAAEWSSVAVVAFVGGFSERFFLRSLGRITGAETDAKTSRCSDDERRIANVD
jgi:hypothetical protein